MKYRINRKTGDRICEIGIGSSYMFGAGMAEAIRALRCAVEDGINYFDLAAGDGKTFPIYGEALHDVRKDIFFQIHFGADYYYDLALAGDAMAVEHYRTLEKNADDCIGCGHCDNRCPFSVKQSERMQEIRSYMGLRTR